MKQQLYCGGCGYPLEQCVRCSEAQRRKYPPFKVKTLALLLRRSANHMEKSRYAKYASDIAEYRSAAKELLDLQTDVVRINNLIRYYSCVIDIHDPDNAPDWYDYQRMAIMGSSY